MTTQNSTTLTPGSPAPLMKKHMGSSNNSTPASISYAQRVPGKLLKHSAKKKKAKNGAGSSQSSRKRKRKLSTPLLILIWYSLGVVSISTSKILLSRYTSPLILSVQQFFLGQIYLSQLIDTSIKDIKVSYEKNLILCSLFFSAGFVLTNFSFNLTSAPAVETVKSGEPITSAIIATLGGVDSITIPEVGSLLVLIAGVLLSTSSGAAGEIGARTFGVVMLSNLSFSARGLYQKRMPKFASGAHLQYHMQRIGFIAFIGPAVLYHLPKLFFMPINFSSDAMLKYLILTIINAVAFASYNLASTSILQRLSVVHHAALNSLRRIFAIVVTSLFFQISLTFVKVLGIVVSLVGFIMYKLLREKRGKSGSKRYTGLLPSVAFDVGGANDDARSL